MAPVIETRQDIVVQEPDDQVAYNQKALAIKWAVFGSLFLILMLWFTVGYWHAQRRMRKGLRPLAYHRWMIPYEQRKPFEPSLQNQFSFYRVNDNAEYGMDAMPPPVYNPNSVAPPTYQPPKGVSKTDLVLDYDLPPAGPPPRNNPSNVEAPSPLADPSRSAWTRRVNPFK
ncbi:hypothetical protein MMC14_005468 [Varicellaria rhodocarpa]|nr:hypothetical protein [Varicellaria rhodocarpa]